MDDLSQKVSEPKPDLSNCDWDECSDRGVYLRCYLDLHKICPQYLTHKHYLNTVREMRDSHENLDN